ncbi:MAG: VWA domain-containing protein [Phycisphaerae bacterium]|nr:VWA domain-containing protein [Phycisphaerae bacterium]
MTLTFLAPWFLLLLPLAILPWWRRRRDRLHSSIAHSSIELAANTGTSLATRLRFLPVLLRSLGIALIVTSIARPVKADEQTRVRVEGIAIQMLIDRSGSMRALDFSLRGQQTNRLTAIKSVAHAFVAGDGALTGRMNDLIGLVSFARYADGISPLTLDHDHVLSALDKIEFASENEDGTAIGDAVALGVERLKDVRMRGDSADGGAETTPVKSRVMILLTDGENTAGDIDPTEAAELARTFNIKVYTIGVGTKGMAPMPMRDRIFGDYVHQVPVTIDEELLRRIAEITGGKYFRATDTESLQSIYGEIDRLERTETEARRYLEYSDLAVEPVTLGSVTIPPILSIAFLLIVLDLILASTRFRSLT